MINFDSNLIVIKVISGKPNSVMWQVVARDDKLVTADMENTANIRAMAIAVFSLKYLLKLS